MVENIRLILHRAEEIVDEQPYSAIIGGIGAESAGAVLIESGITGVPTSKEINVEQPDGTIKYNPPNVGEVAGFVGIEAGLALTGVFACTALSRVVRSKVSSIFTK